MRVLVITVAHPPADARILFREIGALTAQGATVTYAAPFGAFGATPPEHLRTIDMPRSQGSPLQRIPALWAAARMVWTERARQDLVLVHDPEIIPALAVARLPGRRRPVAVWDVHEDVPAQVQMLKLPRVFKAPIALTIHAAELLAEGMFKLLLAEYSYQDRFRQPHPVVPNSTPMPPGGPWPADEAPRVVYLGALTWHRGAAELIETAELVPEVRFQIIGNAKADVEEALLEAAERLPNLEYLGFVPNAAALKLLPGALAGLSMLRNNPNHAHSQPTKLMEYMAYAVPVITTPNPASRTLVEDADAGVVIDFGDAHAAAAAIRRLHADRAERERLSGNAYRAAAANDWNKDGVAFVGQLESWVAGEQPA